MRNTTLFTERLIKAFSLSLLLVHGIAYSSLAMSAAKPKLVIYSGRSDKLIKPVITAFTQATGIKIILHTGTSSNLLDRLKSEQQNSAADIYISSNAVSLYRGDKENLFAPVTNKIAAVINPQFRGQDNHWLGLSAWANVLVINTRAKDIGFVKSVFDLADPRLKRRIAITHSSNENYIAAVTVYMLATDKNKTTDWLKGVKNNTKGRVYNSQSKIVAAVANGNKAVGLVNHYRIYRYLNKHPNASIRILIPDQISVDGNPMGIAWNIAGAAITRHSKHKALAMKFMRFVSSPKGQRIFTDSNYEYPARSDIAAAPMLPKAGSFKVAPVAMYQLGEQRKATIDLIDAVGMP